MSIIIIFNRLLRFRIWHLCGWRVKNGVWTWPFLNLPSWSTFLLLWWTWCQVKIGFVSFCIEQENLTDEHSYVTEKWYVYPRSVGTIKTLPFSHHISMFIALRLQGGRSWWSSNQFPLKSICLIILNITYRLWWGLFLLFHIIQNPSVAAEGEISEKFCDTFFTSGLPPLKCRWG